ncbi:hypothetical protein A2501_00675 [Candidatus Uhrbacteria bacterium RIFOXYC12_FULL_57_11]|nr:MAG: hypothetical protein A2501_00675 [Candidatus Uhrbacteria bacterium RIFOXYC12_FULL_57_11]
MMGGASAEHEVSVVTGLQALERLDRSAYVPHVIFVAKSGEPFLLPGLRDRTGFSRARRVPVSFGLDGRGGFVRTAGWLGKIIRPYAALLAFHGGLGESGPAQGLLESVEIPFTSASVEGSVVAMNKQLTKLVARDAGIPTVPGVSLFAEDIRANVSAAAEHALASLSLPVIVKPSHFGSSIGIHVAKTRVELEKHLMEASFMDSEAIVESYLDPRTELNCAVRRVNGKVQASEIERPMSRDEILSFADKYQRGGKKTGGSMASLDRELPAKINPATREAIQAMAKRAFLACRCKGMVRIDFILDRNGDAYLNEVNPIPGSLAFYLWEATGVSYTEQLTALIEQAVRDADGLREKRLDYASDIIEKFAATGRQ